MSILEKNQCCKNNPYTLEEGTLVQALKGLIKVAFQEVVTGIRDPMIMMINMDETDTKLF